MLIFEYLYALLFMFLLSFHIVFAIGVQLETDIYMLKYTSPMWPRMDLKPNSYLLEKNNASILLLKPFLTFVLHILYRNERKLEKIVGEKNDDIFLNCYPM